MASVKSALRSTLKPILFRMLGETGYEYAQFLGKVKDIRGKLVEEPEMAIFPRLVGPSDHVLDIGANYAYHAHRLAELCPFGLVFAFEPIPFTYRVCQRVVRHFRLENVRLYPLGVGQRTEEAFFRVPVVDFGAISGGQSHLAVRNNELSGKDRHYAFERSQECRCNVVALDDFLPALNKLAFVKMDIEGAEFLALQGMRKLLERHQPIVMLEVNPFFLEGFGIEPAELRQFVAQLGYDFFRYQPATGRLILHSDQFIEANYFLLSQHHRDRHRSLLENV